MRNSGMPPDQGRRLGAVLWRLRREQELTQCEVAAKAGVSQATVSVAEQRASGVSLEALGNLAAALGADLERLLAEDGAR